MELPQHQAHLHVKYEAVLVKPKGSNIVLLAESITGRIPMSKLALVRSK